MRTWLADHPTDSLAVWILFHPDAARTDRRAPLSAAGAERRARDGVPVYDNDRPMPAAVVEAIRDAGARVRHHSRWLRGVSAWVDSATAARVARRPEVRAIRRVGALRAPPATDGAPAPARPAAPDAARVPSQAANAVADTIDYGESRPMLDRVGVPQAHELGFTGTGVRVAILDMGFDREHESLADRRVVAVRDFVDGDTVVGREPGDPADMEAHGTAVWSILGGFQPGRVVGPAFAAEFLLARVDASDAEPRADEDRWIAGLEWAEALGAAVVASSLGYHAFDDGFSYDFDALDGDSALASRAADEAARRGVLVVTAIGNRDVCGSSPCVPADADSVLSVGATDSARQAASFSSRGPTADGRIKPELAAPGVDVPAAATDSVEPYGSLTGTSASTPLVAGAAAVLLQAWDDAGAALDAMAVRRALMHSGHLAHAPDGAVGHGEPRAAEALLFPDGLAALHVEGPRAGDTLRTLLPRFTWSATRVHPVARPVRYRLEVAHDTLFAQPVYTDTVADAFSAMPRRPLRPAERVWWRVVAVTAPGVSRTTRPSGPLVVPPWVRLLTLNDPGGSFIRTRQPTFEWEALAAPAPAGPLRFDVAILSANTGEVVQAVEDLTATAHTAPEPLTYNTPYRWRVVARSPTGVADTVVSSGVFVASSQLRPPVTILHPNFPNPFPMDGQSDPGTRIWFDLHEATTVRLMVYDLRGRMVRRLIPVAGCGPVRLAPGLYGRDENDGGRPCVRTRWNGEDDRGRPVPGGVYLLRLETESVVETRRVLYLPR